MYLNRAQKYVLELLGEYGALKQSQLEIMARYNISEYLGNLNGYLRQMHQEREIDVSLCSGEDAYICLPDTEPNSDVAAAFDIIAALRERVENHRKGTGLTQIQFDFETEKNRIHQGFAMVVHIGMEAAVSKYADKHLSQDFQTVFFLCDSKSQIKKITAECNHTLKGTRIFAVNEKGTIAFFKNK